MADYEIKTMQKDIDKLGNGSVPPESLPIVSSEDKLPGAPLPSEPLEVGELPEPVLPPKTEESFVPPAPVLSSSEKTARPRKFLVPIILAVLVLLVGFGIYYWWNYLRGPEKQAIEPPVSLITTENSEIISIEEGKEATLLIEIEKKAAEFQERNTFRRILVKKIGSSKDYFLPTKEIFEALGINIPTNIADNLKEDNTLFLYSQETGNRLGIIIKAENIDNLNTYLGTWEETMVEDLKPIFLDLSYQITAESAFRVSEYGEIPFRYINLPDSSLGIAYSWVNDKLIIATSKESFRSAIDRLLR